MSSRPEPTTAPAAASALEARVARLEVQLRRARRMVGALSILGAAALLMGQAPTRPRVLTAEAFVLTDAGGKPRGQLALGEDGSASLMLQHARGASDAGLVVLPDGGVALRLRTHRQHAAVELTPEGLGRVRLNHAHGKSSVEVGLDEGARPRVILSDAAGRVVFQAPSSPPEARRVDGPGTP